MCSSCFFLLLLCCRPGSFSSRSCIVFFIYLILSRLATCVFDKNVLPSLYFFAGTDTCCPAYNIRIDCSWGRVGDSEIYAYVQKELRVSKHVTCPRCTYPRKRPKGTKRGGGGCGDESGGTSLLLSSQTLGADASRMLLNQTGFPDIDPHFCVQNHCWGGGGSPTPVSTVRPTPTHPTKQRGPLGGGGRTRGPPGDSGTRPPFKG